jgi:TolA-binding protein
MKWRLCILLIFTGLISACRNDITQDRVKKVSGRSLEIALEYIQQQRALHEADLKHRIRQLDAKIARLPKSSKNTKIISSLEDEKASLQQKLDMLLKNTEASRERIKSRWKRYNASLDAMLKNMDDYMKGYELEKDTAKDTL